MEEEWGVETKQQSCNCHSFMSDINILCMTAEFIVWQTSVPPRASTAGGLHECCFLCIFIPFFRLSCRTTHFLVATITQSNTYVWRIQLEYEIRILFRNISFRLLRICCTRTFQQGRNIYWSHIVNTKAHKILKQRLFWTQNVAISRTGKYSFVQREKIRNSWSTELGLGRVGIYLFIFFKAITFKY